MLQLITEIVLIFTFILSGIKDYRNFTLPIKILGFPYLFVIIDTVMLQGNYIRLLSGGLIFLLFYCNARFFNGGGGDALLLPLLAIRYGLLNSLVIISIGLVLSILIAIYKSFRYNHSVTLNMDIPLISGIAISYCLFQIMIYAIGGTYADFIFFITPFN